ncbi:MAG: negative regulator of septation ring formation, partial [Xanthobacteraceae bacterium]|nr:negative regulator of septation ring formation [Xanthobacteraceae bacterium]
TTRGTMARELEAARTNVEQELASTRNTVSSELESTRSELRRGVFELPHETAESAAQMRRVIVDQIEALAELNRIVARHGRAIDMAEPAQARRNEPVPMLAASGGRVEPSRAVPMAPKRPEIRSEMRSDLTPPPPAPAMQPQTPPPGAPRRADSPSLSPVQGGRGGWLSDLLTRASREDGELPPPPARPAGRGEGPREVRRTEPPRNEAPRGDAGQGPLIESLDSLAVDIARMIDHDVAAEMWERYKRGERNVFTRRLYTIQGQKAFDEISRKYRSEREFKQTVDRYIGEFERLLDDVSRDDRGQVVVRTYLTSETGKVYTMLAHAAGRLD